MDFFGGGAIPVYEIPNPPLTGFFKHQVAIWEDTFSRNLIGNTTFVARKSLNLNKAISCYSTIFLTY